MTRFWRMKQTLYDGRVVYMTARDDQGKVYIDLRSRSEAEAFLLVAPVACSVMSEDPIVYAADLSSYGDRSSYLTTLRPFTMVARTEIEPSEDPLDPAAVIVGPLPARGVPYLFPFQKLPGGFLR